ncbi:hypothetical protein V2J09_012889 [Rumex salicifolius]
MHPNNRAGRGGRSKAPMAGRGGQSKAPTEPEEPEWNFRKIMKEVDNFGSSFLTWKEKKDLENRKIVQLGGKAVKKQRLPLSVARPAMKNQKQRDDKLMKERLALGRFGALLGESSTSKRPVDNKRKPIEMGLRASEGNFVNGCLHVDRLLKPAPRYDVDKSFSMGNNNNNKGKKSQGKRKGGKKNQKKKGGRGGKRH